MNSLQLIASALLMAASSLLYATPREVTPIPVGDQEVIYSRGTPFVFSSGEATALQVSLEGDDSRSFWLTVNFSNLGDDRALVDATRIVPRAFGASGQIEAELISAAELERREKRRQMWEEIGAGVAAGLNNYGASQAGYGTATTTHQGRIRGYGSRSGVVRGTYSGTSRTTFQDPMAAQLAREQARSENERVFASLKEDQELREAALTATLLKSHTVSPGETHSGRLQIELPRRQRGSGVLLSLTVEFAGETHPFLFAVDGAVNPALLRAQVAASEIQLARLRPEVDPTKGVADSSDIASASIEAAPESPEIASAKSQADSSNSSNSGVRQHASSVERDGEELSTPMTESRATSESEASSPSSSTVSGAIESNLSRERPIRPEFSRLFAEAREPAQPIVFSLGDAQFEKSALIRVSRLEDGDVEDVMGAQVSTKVEQKRRESEVDHLLTALSMTAKEGRRRSQSFVMPQGLIMRSVTSSSGALIRAAELIDAQGNVQVSARAVGDKLALMEFSEGPVSAGEVAATSPPTPFSASISSVSEPTKWLLEGELEYGGRQAALLSASMMVRAEMVSGRRRIPANHSLDGYCIVDKETGVVLNQVEVLVVSPIDTRRDQSTAQVRTQIQATLQGGEP